MRYHASIAALTADETVLAEVGPLAPMEDLLLLPAWEGWFVEGQIFCSLKETHGSYERAFGYFVIDWAVRQGDVQLVFGSWVAIFALAAEETLC